jgi:hypothetical protein
LARGAELAPLLRSAAVRYAVVHRTQPGAAAVESALAGLPVRYRSADLLLVELPGPVAPPPAPRRWLAAGLALAGAVLLGALCLTPSGVRSFWLLGSRGTGTGMTAD